MKVLDVLEIMSVSGAGDEENLETIRAVAIQVCGSEENLESYSLEGFTCKDPNE